MSNSGQTGIQEFEGRKRDHIRHALDPVHQATGLSGLDSVHLHHEALPERDLEQVMIVERELATPYYVAGMTAGHSDAAQLNETLAIACERRGWIMGVGSQRRDLEFSGESSSPDRWRRLRQSAPRLKLLANIGIAQLIGTPEDRVLRLVESLEAAGLCIHLNALQEAIQPEGTTRFMGALVALERLCKRSPVPVIVKETGCGFSESTLRRLGPIGLSAVDVSGLGGTHWGRIEGARARETDTAEAQMRAVAAETFGAWGEPTVDSVLNARKALPTGVEIWASGGVRTGLDAAKLIALGACRVGFARPALEAALKGDQELDRWMSSREFELKVALFCTGCGSPQELRNKEGAWKLTRV